MASTRSLYSAAVLLFLLSTLVSAQEVQVSVFYSVLCDHCRGFFSAEFQNVYTDLQDYMNVDLVPYGNSTYTETGGELGYSFECEHGPDECVYGRWHACAVEKASSQPQLVHYVVCTIDSDDFVTVNQRCAEEVGLDFTALQGCVNGAEGHTLLKDHGDRTHGHVPKIGYFPTIEFNGEYHQAEQDLAMEDFREAVCQHLEVDGERPAACSAPALAATSLVLMALLLVSSTWYRA